MSANAPEAPEAPLHEQLLWQRADEGPAASDANASDTATRSSAEGNGAGDTPVELSWAFGFDKGIRNGVHSLSRSTTGEKAVLFPASNTAVLHTYGEEAKASKGDKQVLLRCHINRISAVAVSDDKEWIATGDMGQDSLLIVWNRTQAKHVKVYTNPHPTGVSSVDFTPDAKLLATLSSLIPENYIMGKAPSQKAEEHPDPATPDVPETTDYSDSTNRNATTFSSDIYQGVAIWNWRDSG
ncbi:hypothetical protein, conserved [Eimeria brunetti]|uniref:Cilia- and flagella-associated protein 251 n=1 Tax=Eimeria brunetti TaxID=51314 RepID=U6LLJ9_9EIME|nr:hypothetical protein, conserved [Eimeria brunetti]